MRTTLVRRRPLADHLLVRSTNMLERLNQELKR
jgi:hypothetical protein